MKDKKAEALRCSEALRDFMLAYRARFEAEWRETGVTLAQLRLLKAVQQETGTSAASIARLCNVTPQTLHTMLARAVREGWIVRGSTERNQRFVTATLTAEGTAILRRGMELKERIDAELWHGVSAEAVRELRRTLEAGLANLRERRAEPSHP